MPNTEPKKKKKKLPARTRRELWFLAVFLLLCTVLCLIPVRRRATGSFSQSLVVLRPEQIPDYAGEDYILLNDGVPGFTDYDLRFFEGESYSELDRLGRCGPAFAKLDRTMMPETQREYIGMIRPSGWSQIRYEGLVDSDPPYLFNRCHLIAHALTGQNANEKNLITGTRYLNASVMLPFEESVIEYLERTGNHVLYRVTPYFKNREQLARGVEMEAYSVEDRGRGICFHVFCYNQQPGVAIDYLTGQSRRK